MIERTVVAALVAGLTAAVAVAQHEAHQAAPAHVIFTPAQVAWGEAPPSFPKGARFATLVGDPTKPGPFTIRAVFPAGYKIMPHWHPTAEHVTVLEGTYAMGKGDTFDMKALHSLPPGSFSMMPAETRHFAYTEKGVTIQVHGTGPFTLTYVNPADDPRKAAATAK